jgi:chromosome segregation protein
MLRLERVEIAGFKSFVEKVDLTFPGNVTAVVGPNGCGKSNICDAVAWALGEQNARVLRGERMDDVIFNGSSKRRPLGMAEVVLTLLATNGDSEPDGETLRIGRRVYRDGQGEYFLNDRQVRLKDIQDRLLGTGLGVRAYSVIEQGRIDQVLSTKPQDRRRLIEEAAGITRYKLKKRLAETKLEETQGNLLRLSDILAEIERNCASLKRQASRAARYKAQSETLRSLRAALARARHDRLSETLSAATRLREERRDREALAAALLGEREARLVSARLEASESASARDRHREAVASLEATIERDEALLESNRRATEDLASRRASLEREGLDFFSERARSDRELAELEARLERAVTEARGRSLSREEADRRAAEAAAHLAGVEKELEQARAESLSAAGRRVDARNARHELDLAAERVAASLARLREGTARVLRELQTREAELASAESEERRLAAEAIERARSASEAEEEIASLTREVLEAEAAREVLREAAAASEHRLAALEEVRRGREGGVREVREAIRRAGLAEGGTLSERLRPVAGWEATVDLLLEGDLDAVLAPGDAVRAVAAAQKLPEARFVRTDWTRAAQPEPVRGAAGGWEWAIANFEELNPAERDALPHAAFVETLEEALALSGRYPRVLFATRGRELVRGPLVRCFGTPSAASGVFAARREREDLQSRLARARADLSAAESTLEEARRRKAERESLLPKEQESHRGALAAHSAAQARREGRHAERGRLRLERETLSAEERSLEEEAQKLAMRRRMLDEDEGRCVEAEEATRGRVEALAAAISEARSAAMAAAEELAHRRTEAEVAAERRRSLESARAALAETREVLERRIGEAEGEAGRLARRDEELTRERAEARNRRTESLRAREAESLRLEEASRAAEAMLGSAERAEEQTREARTALDQAREERFEAEVGATRSASDLEHLVQQAREEFGAEPSTLAPPADGSEAGIAALEAEAAELSATLERLGPVNVLALEEYREASERLTFLSVQRDDLLRSIAELQESIRKINATSSERFAEAFTAINANFREVFTRLFRGGTAEMRLLDENDPLESGVEIIAQPPGKRNQSILLLSGGEKALTAIALLMAIFRYKPSPFCILDEVDAPLDEANIDRFTHLLREMTEETQFIAITHNKRTMETADVMYGVTMEEPGCSKIVSVRFD